MGLSISQKIIEGETLSTLKEGVVEVLDNFYDPEIPVSIWQLGLIYELDIDEEKGNVAVVMTLTTPACPVAGEMPGQIKQRIEELEGINEAKVELVWEPTWTPENMSEAAKLELNIFD